MKKSVFLDFLLVVITFPIIATESSWITVAEAVVKPIDETEAASVLGDSKQTKRSVVSAYFGVFEDRTIEGMAAQLLRVIPLPFALAWWWNQRRLQLSAVKV